MFGDHGFAKFNIEQTGTAAVAESKVAVLAIVDSTGASIGGDDALLVCHGDDVVIAGVGDDLVNYVPVKAVASDPINNNNAPPEPTQICDDGVADDDLVIGDNGTAIFDTTTRISLPIEIRTTDYDDSGRDIVIADNGMAIFDTRTGVQLLNKIRSFEPTIGGVDYVFTDRGPDVVIGGTASDVIDAGTDAGGDSDLDVVIADNGIGIFNVDTGVSLLVRLLTTDPDIESSGDDKVTTGAGNDVILGGSGDDDIDAGASFFKDVVLGDNGETWFYLSQILQFAFSTDPADGGDDKIFTGMGADYVIGGVADDWIDAGRDSYGDTSQDTVIGDNGQIDVNPFGQLVEVHTTSPIWGGMDFIITGGGRDIIFGGSEGDFIQSQLDNDHVNGDNGFAYFLDKDGNAGLFEVVQTTDPLIGGEDTIFAGGGYDVVFGGTDADLIFGGAGSDLLLGDHGRFDRSLPPEQNWFSIFTSDADAGGDDTIYGDAGEFIDGNDLASSGYHDIIMGQQGADFLYGGPGDDDITGGHNVVGGDDTGDIIDGQAGADVVLGDNGVIYRIVLTPESEDGDELEWAAYPKPFIDLIRRIQRYDNVDLVEGDDIIDGSDGRDILHGQRGDDILDGGNGDDNVFGEHGDDVAGGGAGHDIVLGDNGEIIHAFNKDGTPRQNENESWHRDVFIEETGTIVGYVMADVDDLFAGDPEIAKAILRADLVIAANVDPANVDSRDTLLILVDLETAGDDLVTGGSGDDALFGQRGNDVVTGGDERSATDRDRLGNFVTDGDDLISGGLGDDNLHGGTGDDLIVGDDFTNTLRVDLDMSEVVHGIRLIDDKTTENADDPNTNGVVIAFGGTILMPPVVLSIDEVIAQGNDYLPRVNTRTDMENGHELVLQDGTDLAPQLQVVPDIFHNTDMAAGNDFIQAGWGNDIVFGDDLTMHTQEFTRFDEINIAFADLTAELLRLISELHLFGLSAELDDLLGGVATSASAAQRAGQVQSLHRGADVVTGNDRIFGGHANGNARPDEGIDTIIGDNGVITPTITGEPYDEDLYEKQALAFHLLLRGLEHVAADTTIFLAERHEALADELGANIALAADLHRLRAGNDFVDVDLDDGPDTVIGDNNIDASGEIIGTVVLDPELRAQIEAALEDQQAEIVDPYTLHNRPLPAPATLTFSGVFGIDEFIADGNDRLVAGNGAAVVVGAFDAAAPADE